jgi:NADPH-dependent glutamate synthase beta subunit-like oxidoreductase
VARLVQAYQNMGIELKLGTDVGRGQASLQRLRRQYDAVLLATGAGKQKKLKMEREEMLLSGIDFLTRIQREGGKAPGKKVLVIGGGNVAVDVAISARRLGARQVTMICLEARDAVPAIPEDLEQAVERASSCCLRGVRTGSSRRAAAGLSSSSARRCSTRKVAPSDLRPRGEEDGRGRRGPSRGQETDLGYLARPARPSAA